jgi:hypothetical protein
MVSLLELAELWTHSFTYNFIDAVEEKEKEDVDLTGGLSFWKD